MPTWSPTDIATLHAVFRQRAEERQAAAQARAAAVRQVLPQIVEVLTERFGARRVWLFGSLAWGQPDEASDCDLATEGMPAERLLEAFGVLEDLLLSAGAPGPDLVRVEEAPPALAARIRAEGEVLHGG